MALGRQQRAEDAIEGDRVSHVTLGYSALTEHLLQRFRRAGGVLQLDTEVLSLRWIAGETTLVLRSMPAQTESRSQRAVIAVPLGVLQAGRPQIDPAPASYAALDQMAMGQVHRISVLFKERFWATAGMADLRFLFTEEVVPGVWWTSAPSPMPVLTGWIGGRRAEKMTSNEFREKSMTALSRIFGLEESRLAGLIHSVHMHDWTHDRWSCGAYSYVRVGGIAASEKLSEPVANTLFMAGEHTDTSGHWGTVHGAMRSGVRAARQVLQSF